jgi:hypothetical protein
MPTWLLSRQASALHILILAFSFRIGKCSLRSHGRQVQVEPTRVWSCCTGQRRRHRRPVQVVEPLTAAERLPGSEAPAAHRANVSSASGGCRRRRVSSLWIPCLSPPAWACGGSTCGRRVPGTTRTPCRCGRRGSWAGSRTVPMRTAVAYVSWTPRCAGLARGGERHEAQGRVLALPHHHRDCAFATELK